MGQRVAGTHTFRRVAVERSELTVLGNTSSPQAVRKGHDLNQKIYNGLAHIGWNLTRPEVVQHCW